jgi:hypothetical protein
MTKISNLYSLTNYITANSSGSISIAPPTSGFTLDVSGSSRFTGQLSGSNATFTNAVTASAFIPTGSAIPTNGMYLPAANTLAFATSGTVDMTLTSTGNVGIGTTSPSSPLDVVASNSTAIHLRLRGRAADNVGQMEFWNNDQSTRYGYIATDSTSYGIVSTQAIPLVLGTNSTERMRITSGGNALIGTTTDAGFKLDVNGTGRFSGQLNGSIGVNVGANALGADRMFQVSGTSFTSGSGQFGMVLNPTMGTLTTLYGIYVGTNCTSATNSYAIYIEGSGGTVTNKYGIYQSGGSDKNYFAGNVGIGTTAPGSLLEVFGGGYGTSIVIKTSSVNGADLTLINTGAGGKRWDIVSGGSNNAIGAGGLQFYNETDSSMRMGITSGGNVLIGTTTDAGYKLDVNGTGRYFTNSNSVVDILTLYNVSATSAGVRQRFQNGFGDLAAISVSQRDNGALADDGQMQFQVASNAVLDTKMTILNNGNVGIGTSSISSALTGSAKVLAIVDNTTANLSSFRAYGGSSATSIELYASGGEFGLYGATNHPMAFHTNGTERMRITSGGTVGIGTSGRAWNASYKSLELGNGFGMMAHASNSDGYIASNTYYDNAWRISAQTGIKPTVARIYDGFQIQSGTTNSIGATTTLTTHFEITSNGNIGMPTTYGFTTSNAANLYIDSGAGFLYRSTSSLKYKTNVRNYDKGLDIVSQMRPVYYEGIGASDSGKVFAGLIAEEVHDLGLTEFVQYAEDGTPDALAYQNMVSLLIKGMQELKAELDTAKQEITELKLAK